jgi:isochorismate synthase
LGGLSFGNTPVSPDSAWADLGACRFVLPEVAWMVETTSTGEAARCWLQVALPCDATDLDRRLLRAEEALSASHLSPRGLPSREIDPTASAEPFEDASIHPQGSSNGRRAYRHSVERAREAIADDQFDKVVLARAVDVPLDPFDNATVCEAMLLERLSQANPEATLFATGVADTLFLGATPERLVLLHGRRLKTEALAGTRSVGEAARRTGRRNPEKDSREHELVVRDLKQRLRPWCSILEEGSRRERRAGLALHLHTPLHGLLLRQRHVLEVVQELHPTPAVAGMPRSAAMSWIRDHEELDRGWYAAPFGWFDAAGNGEFVVALRSARVQRGRATLYAGAGIVEGSSPRAELLETDLKLTTMRRVLAATAAQREQQVDRTAIPPSLSLRAIS